MSCSPRSPGCAQTGVSILYRSNKVAIFTHPLIRDLLPEDHQICCGTAAYKGKLDSKSEVNRARRFRDTSEQVLFFVFFVFFLSLFFSLFGQITKSVLTPKCVLRSG